MAQGRAYGPVNTQPATQQKSLDGQGAAKPASQSLSPRKKDGFFPLLKKIDFQNKYFLHLQAGFTSWATHIDQPFIVNFLLVELEKNII